jgi:hypothetical protein
MVAAYRDPGRTKERHPIEELFASLGHYVPISLTEGQRITPGRERKSAVRV